ncbi:transposase [Aeromonas jandaei]|uniref:transposase n=1 Tax=Aeromonas jandaei TaxID=650 RepID=UPI003BB6F9BF
MTKLSRSFTAEFKLEAASLVLAILGASRSLDVGETVLRRWVQELEARITLVCYAFAVPTSYFYKNLARKRTINS